MMEALFGLIGVILGSSITWLQSYWSTRKATEKNAKYLAIRIVCILDRFMEDCTEVVKDDGPSYGQRTPDGCLKPKVKVPTPPLYPDDVDWTSINHELMYRLLSFPAEVMDGDRMIEFTWEITGSPDFEDWFDERKFQYSQFGLMAYRLSADFGSTYGITKKTYNDWDPIADLKQDLETAAGRRRSRTDEYKAIIKKILG